MRLILSLCCALALCGHVLAAEKSVTFDGQTLYLAFEDDKPTVRLEEFIQKGETLQNWTRLAGIFEYPKDNDPKTLAANIARLVKEQNPAAQSSIIENEASGDVILDFVTWPADESCIEFNIFRFSKNPQGGLSARQYALREYKDIPGFLKKLKPLRLRLIESMAKDGFKIQK